MGVKVIPRTTGGTPNVGTETPSEKTAAVIAWSPPVYKKEQYQSIADAGGWVASYLQVKDAGTITDQRLQVRIIHPNIGDLEVRLAGPNSQEIVLHARTGGSEDNLIREYAIKGLGNQQAGWWALYVRDSAAGNVGYVDPGA